MAVKFTKAPKIVLQLQSDVIVEAGAVEFDYFHVLFSICEGNKTDTE